MDISSSNYFSVSASTNKGMSGMVSGMDTESMVKQMLSGTQGKIDKQMGLKQQAEWKQEIYRDVITSINDFQAKYLDTSYGSTLKTNFASTTFFNAMLSSVTGGDGVRILSTGTGAAEGETRVGVTSLATAARLESSANMSSGKITGSKLNEDTLKAKLDKRIAFTVNGSGTETVVQVDLNNITTEDGMVKALNDAFAAAGQGVKAEIFEDRMRLVSGDGVKVNVKADVAGETTALGLEMTGLGSYSASSVTGADGVTRRLLQGSFVDAAAGPTFTVTLDGVEKQITLNAAADMREKVLDSGGKEINNPNYGKVTIDSVKGALQTELNKAFGDYVTVQRPTDGAGDPLDYLELGLNCKDSDGNLSSIGHELVVTGMDAKILGLTPGATSALDTGTKLKDLQGDHRPAGDQFEFTINGEKFSFTGNDSVGAVINTINNSGAGVRLTYSTLTDKFEMTAASTGAQYGIEIEQTRGDLLTKLFGSGVADGTAYASKELTVGAIAGEALDAGFTAESGASLKLNVDGKNYTFTLPKVNKESYKFDKGEIVDQLNNWLKTNFHDDSGAATITYDGATGALKVADGSVVKFTKTSLDSYDAEAMEKGKKTDLGLAMGFAATGKSNVATGAEDISEIVQLKDMGFSSGSALSDVIAALSNVSFENGRLILTGTVPPLTGGTDTQDPTKIQKLFGVDSLPFNALNTGKTEIKNGTDAELTINGVSTTRSSNTFTIDGITMEAVKAGGETTIGAKRDTETIVEGFQSFVDDYNALVKKLTDLVDEKQSYRSYAPLTSEQKKDMSERETELWEEKAKEGLLHRDSAIDSFLSEMRLAMYTKPAGSKLALYNIGIETTKWEDKGQLELDETALRNALATDPNSVMTLFTDRENGLGAMLNSIIQSAANPSSASPGSLVRIAGVEGWGSETNNNLSDNISSIASRIKDLQARYESERARYWNQFNAMETALANFNAQSNMIAQQFSSGY